jgi:hypothetical protein
MRDGGAFLGRQRRRRARVRRVGAFLREALARQRGDGIRRRRLSHAEMGGDGADARARRRAGDVKQRARLRRIEADVARSAPALGAQGGADALKAVAQPAGEGRVGSVVHGK